MTEKWEEQIQETHDTVVTIKAVLLGVPDTDDTGLVGDVKSLAEQHNTLDSKHHKLSRNFWILVAALGGSGVLGGGIWGLLQQVG